MKASVSVGVVGVGNMGLAMALRLRELGHRVQVRDIDARREAMAEGCAVAASPAALAAGLAAADDSSLWQLACDAPRPPAPPQNAP